MEVDQNLIGQEDKKWDRPWTTDEIRKNSANWTLAGDVGLYNLLNEFSQNLISRTHEVENAVDSLIYKAKMTNAKINNVINDFHMLSNLQFIESRVYDEEIQETTSETKPPEKTKEQKEAEMLPKIIKAVELGLQVLDQAFNKINVNEISDSEDEDLSSEGRTILEPKDPFEHRPLPFIIGSEEFQNSDYAGLQDLLEEDADYSIEVESSVSDSEETSTDEEEPLPLDEGRFTGKPAPPQNVNDRFSSSEESELFGSEKEDNGFASDSSFDSKIKEDKIIEEDIKIKDSRQSSVSTIQSKLNLPQVLPTPKLSEKKKEKDDLFASNEEASDDESPFRKKTGLFTSDMRFDEEKDMFDNDLFGDIPKETKKVAYKPKPSPIKTKLPEKKKEEVSLFDNDEDSEDDIFNTLVKKPSVTKETAVKQEESPDKGDSSSTPSSAPSSKHSGNAFDFLSAPSNTDNLFGEESDAEDLFTTKKTQKIFGFDPAQDDDDDLFGLMSGKSSKKAELQISDDKKPDSATNSSLFEESTEVEKPYKKIGQPLPGLVPVKTKESPNKENVAPKSVKKIGQPLPGLVSKKTKDSIFEDSDSSGQEDKVPVQKAPSKKADISLFEDDDADDDIFNQGPKKLLSPGKSPSLTNKPQKSQENEPKIVETKKTEKPHTPSLFDVDDDDDDFLQVTESKLPTKKVTSKDLSLFEDSDNFDLFSPKTQTSQPKPSISPLVHDNADENSIFKAPSEIGGIFSSKKEPIDLINEDSKSNGDQVDIIPSKIEPPSPSKAASVDAPAVGFDTPVDTSKTLHVLNKDRAKISSKRRKPTKKGRIAALESTADKESPPTSEVPKNNEAASNLFSAEPSPPSSFPEASPTTHKVQEKKKKDLMSQLMSEVAVSKIGKKATVVPPVDEDEDEVDIFSEMSSKDRSRSRGFSFKSPIESTVKPKDESPEDKKVEAKEVTSVLDLEDTDNVEFFAEPSFKNFRSSISHKDSILDLDDDDDDDLFSSIKTSSLPKPKLEASNDSDIFADDTDIFAELQKEKYEMFPSQLYDDDEEDDIFSQPINSSSSKATSVPVKKEAEKKPVGAFDDPLTGLLGDD